MESDTHSGPRPQRCNVILLGRTGSGKSACGNTILGKKAFCSKKSFKTVTQEVKMESREFDGMTLNVYDTPGLFDPEKNIDETFEQWKPLLSIDESALNVILLVIKTDRFTVEEKKAVSLIEGFLPEWLIPNTWILFTRGDELEREDQTIQEFIDETKELNEVVQRFQNKFHVFNNFSESPNQVRRLIDKIKKAPQINSSEMKLSRTIPSDPEEDPLHRRIVLLGKTGSGKSATGNTILGEKRFRSELRQSSVTSKSEMQQAVVAGRNVSVIDTPGLFDTNMEPKVLAEEIAKSFYLSAPGPHAFLLNLPVNARFTEQEENVIQELEVIFGREMNKYTIILFTYGDLLEGNSIDKVIQDNRSLRKLIDQCGGRYQIFNNNEPRNRKQVTELLEKIDRMVEEGGGCCYSNKMFEEAAKARRKAQFKFFLKKHKVFFILAGCIVAGLFGGTVGVGVSIACGASMCCGTAIGFSAGIVSSAITAGCIELHEHVTSNKQRSQSTENGSAAVSTEYENDSESDSDSVNIKENHDKCPLVNV